MPIEIHNGIMIDFYPGLPHLPKLCSLQKCHIPTRYFTTTTYPETNYCTCITCIRPNYSVKGNLYVTHLYTQNIFWLHCYGTHGLSDSPRGRSVDRKLITHAVYYEAFVTIILKISGSFTSTDYVERLVRSQKTDQ